MSKNNLLNSNFCPRTNSCNFLCVCPTNKTVLRQESQLLSQNGNVRNVLRIYHFLSSKLYMNYISVIIASTIFHIVDNLKLKRKQVEIPIYIYACIYHWDKKLSRLFYILLSWQLAHFNRMSNYIPSTPPFRCHLINVFAF